MPNTLHNITVTLVGIMLVAAIFTGVRIASYKLMFEDQVKATVLEVLEEGR